MNYQTNMYYIQTSDQQRLSKIKAQYELARNYYDDFEFCPLQCSSEVLEHRERIQQRLSSPSTSPSMSSMTSSPSINSKKAIPIINPTNMTLVNVPNPSVYYHHYYHPMY